jgi:CDP-paratose 2-epimerase
MKWLVTGGCGFIGTNLVIHLLDFDHQVVVLDDLSRSGSELNAKFLEESRNIEVHKGDISQAQSLQSFLEEFGKFDVIANLAGQVSMMSSLRNPLRDFEVNTRGVLNFLEHIRNFSPETVFINMASNKVYGDLDELHYEELETRYICPEWPMGFDESLKLDFKTPYGCSKGAADQYLGDFAAIYGLRAISLRQSSVYGPFQHPRDDQGWVSFLVREALDGRSIQLNGNGKQVRDLLHVSDLVRLLESIPSSVKAGNRYQVNVGGGVANSLSILELFSLLKNEFHLKVDYKSGSPRVSDQKVFVSSNSAICELTGWKPQVSPIDGISVMISELKQNKN